MLSVDERCWQEKLRASVLNVIKEYFDLNHAALEDSRLEPIGKNSTVVDGHSAYLFGSNYVVLVSSAQFPGTSSVEAEKMQTMRAYLDQITRRVILDVIGPGRVDGRTFFLVPRCAQLPRSPIARRLGKWKVQNEVLNWLRQIVAQAHPPSDAAMREFLASLAALEVMDHLPDKIRRAASGHARLLLQHELQARHVPMHGDLWLGNIMRKPDQSLAIIDWGGSEVLGYGIYDLIRIASSLELSTRRLATEVHWHTLALGGSRHLAELHLLGALGHYARHIHEFQPDRFTAMTRHCYDVLNSVL